MRIVADTLALDSQWVPLATTRRFLAANRELVGKVRRFIATVFNYSKAMRHGGTKTIGRQLPALRNQPQVLDKCYRVFAELFEPTLILSQSSLSAVVDEVALQDSRANNLQLSSIAENIF